MDKTKDKPNIIASAPKPKEKRRSNEKRKEKSRDAARCRRSRETEIFTELGQVLPLQREEVEQLDKASIMRLSIAYLKIRDMLNLFPNVNIHDQTLLPSEDDRNEEFERKPFDLLNGPESYKYLASALDGFLLILSGEGDVTYVSESISDYLGISQIDLLGQQIWEYTHQCDHDELKEALNIRRSNLGDEKPKEGASNGNAGINGAIDNNNTLTTAHRDIFLRLKCTLTSRGRSVNIKSASYKVIHVTGHMVMNTSGDRTLIGIGRPLPHPSNIEIPLGSATFLTKHSLDMKFTYVDDKMLSLLGYQPEDLLGKSLYDCHHGADSESLMTTFKSGEYHKWMREDNL
ncbi:unnamed protein product [Hermetia illucens]|uniref:Uncharacterized protein n=1 Tax=Hermetia illucens TaxID=343691 RepID=A0A7R8YVM5_HERIL|nr:unnamed protein product [Hermetia illucens]